jgi:hypothetical protein
MPIKSRKFEGLFVNPFSDKFVPIWELWKSYKWEAFKFRYATEMSQQAAINELVELSEGDEKTAEKIINQSMANNWKGLFALKTLKVLPGGKSKPANTDGATRESVNSALNERFKGSK